MCRAVTGRKGEATPFIYAPNASAIAKVLKAGNVLQYIPLHDSGVQIA